MPRNTIIPPSGDLVPGSIAAAAILFSTRYNNTTACCVPRSSLLLGRATYYEVLIACFLHHDFQVLNSITIVHTQYVRNASAAVGAMLLSHDIIKGCIYQYFMNGGGNIATMKRMISVAFTVLFIVMRVTVKK